MRSEARRGEGWAVGRWAGVAAGAGGQKGRRGGVRSQEKKA